MDSRNRHRTAFHLSSGKRRLAVILGLPLLLIATILVYRTSANPHLDETSLLVTVRGTATDDVVSYDVTLINGAAVPIRNVYVVARIPTGSAFEAATANPPGSSFRGVETGSVVWLANEVPVGGRLGPFAYRVRVAGADVGSATAFAHWESPSGGTAESDEATYAAAVEAGAPRRGCQACHVLVDPVTGKFTLGWEAMNRSAASGGHHPTVAPDGTPIDPKSHSGAEPCLLCHKPDTGAREGSRVGAPPSLRDIVHPAHMFSNAFTQRHGGNCFSCHDISDSGTWQLLSR